jgi:hypothetical protein
MSATGVLCPSCNAVRKSKTLAGLYACRLRIVDNDTLGDGQVSTHLSVIFLPSMHTVVLARCNTPSSACATRRIFSASVLSASGHCMSTASGTSFLSSRRGVYGVCADDDDFYMFLQKQKLAKRYIPFSGISFW